MRDWAADLEWIRHKMPMRVQFTCYNVLVAEVVVQGTIEADRVNNAYLNARHKVGKPMGGSISSRADLPKSFSARVGATITD